MRLLCVLSLLLFSVGTLAETPQFEDNGQNSIEAQHRVFRARADLGLHQVTKRYHEAFSVLNSARRDLALLETESEKEKTLLAVSMVVQILTEDRREDPYNFISCSFSSSEVMAYLFALNPNIVTPFLDKPSNELILSWLGTHCADHWCEPEALLNLVQMRLDSLIKNLKVSDQCLATRIGFKN